MPWFLLLYFNGSVGKHIGNGSLEMGRPFTEICTHGRIFGREVIWDAVCLRVRRHVIQLCFQKSVSARAASAYLRGKVTSCVTDASYHIANGGEGRLFVLGCQFIGDFPDMSVIRAVHDVDLQMMMAFKRGDSPTEERELQ